MLTVCSGNRKVKTSSQKSSIKGWSLHATELQAVSVRLMVWYQVIVVEYSYLKHCRVDTHTEEEDTDKARHLVGENT